eukprot:SAG11_NODE_4073_length_2078_cov_4.146539_1_plen_118_part_00
MAVLRLHELDGLRLTLLRNEEVPVDVFRVRISTQHSKAAVRVRWSGGALCGGGVGQVPDPTLSDQIAAKQGEVDALEGSLAAKRAELTTLLEAGKADNTKQAAADQARADAAAKKLF